MRITYDNGTNALTILPMEPRQVAQTVQVSPHVRVDLDANGSLAGVEIVDAVNELSLPPSQDALRVLRAVRVERIDAP
jgi:uncharacterized protein YuzE